MTTNKYHITGINFCGIRLECMFSHHDKDDSLGSYPVSEHFELERADHQGEEITPILSFDQKLEIEHIALEKHHKKLKQVEVEQRNDF